MIIRDPHGIAKVDDAATISEDAGAQSLSWASNISTGAANESGQTLTFLVAMVFGLQELSLVSALIRIGGVFLLGEFLEGYVFIPKILGDSLGLHPVVVLVSIFAGGASLGMFGFLIAIPLMAALVILARELLLPALRQFADEDSHVDAPPPRGDGSAQPPSGWQGGAPG